MKLTKRQNEIALLLCDGCTSKIIGISLGIAENTVKNAIQRMVKRNGFETRAQLAFRLGYEQGRKAANRQEKIDSSEIGNVYRELGRV